MNYLELVRQTAFDLGVSNWDQVTDVQSLRDRELQKIAGYVATADYSIQGLWENWKFMRRYLTATITAGDNTVTGLPTDIAQPNRMELWMFSGTINAQKLDCMPWHQYYSDYFHHPAQSSLTPSVFSFDDIAGNGSLYVDVQPTQDIPLSGVYYRTKQRMSQNNDQSLIPLENRRIIVCRAGAYWAQYQDDSSAAMSLIDELEDEQERLETMYKPGHEGRRGSGFDPANDRPGGGQMNWQ